MNPEGAERDLRAAIIRDHLADGVFDGDSAFIELDMNLARMTQEGWWEGATWEKRFDALSHF